MELKHARILIILLSALLVLPLVSASFKCYTKVEFNDETIQINPKQTEIQQIGLIDYFEPQPSGSKYQYVNVYFTKKDLRDGQAVNFSVVCAGENQTFTFEREVTPQFKDPSIAVGDTAVFAGENATWILFAVLGIFVILLVIVGVWRGLKK